MPRPCSLKLLAATLPALMLGACVSFGPKAPPQLLTLGAVPAPPSTPGVDSATSITVLDPEASRKLDTTRVPVQVDATSIAYIKGAQWVDTPRHLFRKLLADKIAGSGALVLEPGQYPLNSGRRLTGELIDFGIDARSRTAVVTYEATLTQSNGPNILRRRFTASAPISKIEAGTVARPIDRAAQQVGDQVAEWVKAN